MPHPLHDDVRTALLREWTQRDAAFADAHPGVWTDWRTKSDLLRRGETVNFHGDDLPRELRRRHRIHAAGYYMVLPDGRVLNQPTYP